MKNSIGLCAKDKRRIRKQRASGEALKVMAMHYGVSISTIWKVVKGIR